MSTERNEYKTGQWDSAVGPALGAAAAISSKSLVPEARLELARLAAADFESAASTIPPLGPFRRAV